ncbi:MAG: radical SAM protein, partial [Ruminococcus sp.]|nr:radical SAM protein [Candidatus Apopatosoma intestinale]
GICITGGEPLLQKDISDFIQKCKSLGYRVKLDTNGSFPAKLKELAGAGLLDYVAMDVKNCREKYGMTVGLPHFDTAPIEESVAFLLSGKVPFEFRTTVVEEFHTVEDIVKISEWIAGAPRYFLQNFVDSEHLIGENLHPASKDTLSAMRDAARKNVPPTNLRGLG